MKNTISKGNANQSDSDWLGMSFKNCIFHVNYLMIIETFCDVKGLFAFHVEIFQF